MAAAMVPIVPFGAFRLRKKGIEDHNFEICRERAIPPTSRSEEGRWHAILFVHVVYRVTTKEGFGPMPQK
ncbi:MAG: hypothetical protein U1E05_19080, partial [Patescibacteria group bacterium]|nr:hypothetical protein [Patescibacteria group bacterium]